MEPQVIFLLWGFLTLISNTSASKVAGCNFPPEWKGSWFQSGFNSPIVVTDYTMSGKGTCIESNSKDKFIIRDELERCYRCLVITQRHEIVLQYKETLCMDNLGGLEKQCNTINADNPLFSMFRVEPKAHPIKCPFGRPPFDYTYSKGNGDCLQPMSRIDSCIDESHLQLRNAACTDIVGAQEMVEVLECLAVWKEGAQHYLMGKLTHQMATTDEDRFRCFIYETSGDKNTIQVAQSGDASCSGLSSPVEGSKTMRLTRVDNAHAHCHFPQWVTEHHHWHTLDMAQMYSFRESTVKIHVARDPSLSGSSASGEASSVGRGAFGGYHMEGGLKLGLRGDRHHDRDISGVCYNVTATSDHPSKMAKIVVRVVSECESGYICMTIYQRDGHVIEVQQSNQTTQVPDDACKPPNFNPNNRQFITLATQNLRYRQCPHLGRYTVAGQMNRRRRRSKNGPSGDLDSSQSGVLCSHNDFQTFFVGCNRNNHEMEFHSSCGKEALTYSCHGSWEENGTSYLIASPRSRKSGSSKRYCFIYTREHPAQALPLGHSGESWMKLAGSTSANGPVAAASRSAILRLSTVSETCVRDLIPGVEVSFALNLTHDGQCEEADGYGTGSATVAQLSFILLVSMQCTLGALRR